MCANKENKYFPEKYTDFNGFINLIIVLREGLFACSASDGNVIIPELVGW